MKCIKIYLDNCCFNRPYDDQGYLTIFLETQAKLEIQKLIENDDLKLCWSFILDFENSANPDKLIMKEIFQWRRKASVFIKKNEKIVITAKEIFNNGLKKKDALHLACAISAKNDYFLTVDKGILKYKDKIQSIKICNPIDFIKLIEGK